MSKEDKDFEEASEESAFSTFLDALSERISEADERNIKLLSELEFPVPLQGVLVNRDVMNDLFGEKDTGFLVSIRPCKEDRSYVGIFLGNFILENTFFYDADEEKLIVSPRRNPAIYVPELKRVVWGCESWWGKIEDVAEAHDITDEDIQNSPAMVMLRTLAEAEKKKEEEREGG